MEGAGGKELWASEHLSRVFSECIEESMRATEEKQVEEKRRGRRKERVIEWLVG